MDSANVRVAQRSWFQATVFAVVCLLAWSSGVFDSVDYDVPEVDIPAAKALMEAGAVVIDVRPESAYDDRHIPGALLIPLAMLRAGIPAELEGLKEQDIVIYCNQGTQVGKEATHILNEAGYARARNLRSGISGWADAGQPITES